MSLPTKSALLHEEIFPQLSLLDLDFPLGPCWALFPMSLPTKSALLHEEIFRVVSSAKLCFACTSHRPNLPYILMSLTTTIIKHRVVLPVLPILPKLTLHPHVPHYHNHNASGLL